MCASKLAVCNLVSSKDQQSPLNHYHGTEQGRHIVDVSQSLPSLETLPQGELALMLPSLGPAGSQATTVLPESQGTAKGSWVCNAETSGA